MYRCLAPFCQVYLHGTRDRGIMTFGWEQLLTLLHGRDGFSIYRGGANPLSGVCGGIVDSEVGYISCCSLVFIGLAFMVVHLDRLLGSNLNAYSCVVWIVGVRNDSKVEGLLQIFCGTA